MWDCHGRYVHIKDVKDMRVMHIDGVPIIFISRNTIPICITMAALEETYAPRTI